MFVLHRSALASFSLAAVLLVGPASRLPAQEFDTRYIPSTAVAAVIAHPNKLLTSPEMRLMPIEVFSAAGKQHTGINPLDIQQAVLVVDKMKNPGMPPDTGLIIRLSKPYQQDQILPAMFEGAEAVEAGGATYLRGAAPMMNALHLPDPQTVILANDAMMPQMLAATQPTGHLVSLLKATSVDHHLMAVASIDAMRAEVEALVAQAPEVPPPFGQFLAIPEHTSAVALRMNLTDKFKMDLILVGRSDQSAQELERLMTMAVAMGKEAALNVAQQELMKQGDDADPVQQAMARYTQRMAEYYAQMLQPRRAGQSVVISAESDLGMTSMGAIAAAMLPALQGAGGALQQTNSANNLKQIGLAFHNYHDTFREFPTDVTDDQGKKLLSWRVRILPFVEGAALYEQFRLDESWDSDHNMALLAQMPETYKNPALKDPTATNYLAVKGPGTMWEDGTKELSFRHVTDGTSNTVMVVEANADKAVPWTKPDDLQVDMNNPLTGLGDIRPQGFNVLFADAAVRMLTKAIDPATLKALFTRAGGEVVDRNF